MTDFSIMRFLSEISDVPRGHRVWCVWSNEPISVFISTELFVNFLFKVLGGECVCVYHSKIESSSPCILHWGNCCLIFFFNCSICMNGIIKFGFVLTVTHRDSRHSLCHNHCKMFYRRLKVFIVKQRLFCQKIKRISLAPGFMLCMYNEVE